MRVTRFHDGSGNAVVAHDNITERKQAELREAAHSQAMKLMTRQTIERNPSLVSKLLLAFHN